MSKDYFHRQKLTAVPSGGFLKVYKDSNENVGAVPEYMPTALLGQPIAGGVTPVYLDAANQSLSGAGAANITSTVTFFTSTGAAQAVTLANGTVTGQIKTVTHVVDGGDGVLTPATFEDGTSVALGAVGDSWTGIWTGTAWRTLSLGGAAAIT